LQLSQASLAVSRSIRSMSRTCHAPHAAFGHCVSSQPRVESSQSCTIPVSSASLLGLPMNTSFLSAKVAVRAAISLIGLPARPKFCTQASNLVHDDDGDRTRGKPGGRIRADQIQESARISLLFRRGSIVPRRRRHVSHLGLEPRRHLDHRFHAFTRERRRQVDIRKDDQDRARVEVDCETHKVQDGRFGPARLRPACTRPRGATAQTANRRASPPASTTSGSSTAHWSTVNSGGGCKPAHRSRQKATCAGSASSIALSIAGILAGESAPVLWKRRVSSTVHDRFPRDRRQRSSFELAALPVPEVCFGELHCGSAFGFFRRLGLVFPKAIIAA
jgi:hypothetical protein